LYYNGVIIISITPVYDYIIFISKWKEYFIMFVEVGIVVVIVLAVIGYFVKLYEKYTSTKDNALTKTDDTISSRVTNLEQNYIDDLKSEKMYVTHEQFMTEMKEFKIEITASFKETTTEIKKEVEKLGKKIDTLNGNTVTKEECSEKRKAMTGII
jgi:hypothetical protein